jgi:2-dehydropantoate 2-reductase
MRMLMVGVGPIGGIIGGRLARAGHDIVFVDVDKEHVAAIRNHGLQVDVPDGAFNVRVRIVFPNEIGGKFDIAFIAVRSNYTSTAVVTTIPHLADNGLLVSLQNGFNTPVMEETVGPDRTVEWRSAWVANKSLRRGCRRRTVVIFTSVTCIARQRRNWQDCASFSIL